MRYLRAISQFSFAALGAIAASATIIAFFAGIYVFGINPHPKSPRRSLDAANLRQIAQASLIFAAENNGRLPVAENLSDYALSLAIVAGLNDATVWFPNGAPLPKNISVVVLGMYTSPKQTLRIEPNFTQQTYGFCVPLGGITTDMPATTPIGWTRGLDLDRGVWSNDSPYRGKGGHIVFLGGNVAFYKNLTGHGGELINFVTGNRTASLREALPPGTKTTDTNPTPSKTNGSVKPGFDITIYEEQLQYPLLALWLVWAVLLYLTFFNLFYYELMREEPVKVGRKITISLIITPAFLLLMTAMIIP